MILGAASIVLLYGFFTLVGIGCPIKFVTGVSCAGCGMSRAWLHVIRFDIKSAFYYHPLFWTIPVVAVLFLVKDRFPRVYKMTSGIVVALFLVVYVIRMLDPSCDIVTFELRESVFYRIADSLITLFKRVVLQ